jgi:copper chaperone CopZ
VAISYVHDLPGRLRVRIPATKGNSISAEKLVNRINALEGIASVDANPVTGSILIRYDTAIINAAACLAVLNHATVWEPARPIAVQSRLASKMAEAAMWYVLEKTVERCFMLILAALV